MEDGLDGCPDRTVLAAFAAGRVDPAAIRSLEDHLADCNACAHALGQAVAAATIAATDDLSLAPRSSDVGSSSISPSLDADAALTPGQSIGRFVVLHLIGRGGMGDVYAAYDPKLDRKVAVKLLSGRLVGSSDGQVRLLREAQAIARLSHPNVVVAYDFGTLDHNVFIAMEFIHGRTLRAWLRSETRDWRETLRVFIAAGRGLAAAHRAGIVHRDFKPENVMVSDEGHARVMDFGLARQFLQDPEQAPTPDRDVKTVQLDRDVRTDNTLTAPPAGLVDDSGGGSSSSAYLGLRITRSGMQIGTPAYMAPEQFLKYEAIDARADQFSFCVALYEALYGQRPFVGNTFSALRASVLGGAVVPPPEKRHIPVQIRRILLRGLGRDPADRFPSMNSLLAALESTLARTQHNWLIAAAGAVLALGVALLVHRSGTAPPQIMCSQGAQRLAGIWEPPGVSSPRKDAIRQSFSRTGVAHAAQAFDATAKLLDGYSAQWISEYQDACEATHVRGEQSADALDLRMACLQERLTSLRALSNTLMSADDVTVANASSAAASLPPLDRCEDVQLLRMVVKPPDNEETRRRVSDLRERISQLDALRDSGKCAGLEEKAEDIIAMARSLGYQPLLADALHSAGLLVNVCGEYPERAADRWKESYLAASLGHHDEAVAQAATQIPALLAGRMNQVPLAREWLHVARAAVERVGDNPRLHVFLAVTEGIVLQSERKYGPALEWFERARELSERTHGIGHLDSITCNIDIVVCLYEAGLLDKTLDRARAELPVVTRSLGEHHPIVGAFVYYEGESLNGLGRYAEAETAFRQALGIWRNAGSDARFLSFGLTGLGKALLGEGRADDAIAPLEEAAALETRKDMEPHEIAETHFALARALSSRPKARSLSIDLARQARVETGNDDPKQASEIDVWLATALATR